MLGAYPLRASAPFNGLVSRLREWPVASQLQARRNALVASTACAKRRAEREDVADFLDAIEHPGTVTVTTPVHPPISRAAHG